MQKARAGKRQRILFTGYFDRGNLGDNAMRLALSQFFAKELPGSDLIWESLPDFEPRRPLKLMSFLGSVARADAVVLAGGTHFHDTLGPRSIRILASFLGVFAIARLTGGMVAHACIGVGPVTSPVGRWLTKAILGLSATTLVRDQPSAAAVKSLASRTTLIEGFDSAVLLNAESVLSGKNGYTIGISLVPYFELFAADSASDLAVVTALVTALKQLKQEIPCLRVKVLVFSDSYPDGDRQISYSLAEALAPTIPVTTIICADPSEALVQVCGLDAFIASRYHALMFSYVTGRPVIAIPYHEKCEALASQMGLADHAILQPRDTLQSSLLTDRLVDLKNHPDRYLATSSLDDSREQASSALRRLASRLPAGVQS